MERLVVVTLLLCAAPASAQVLVADAAGCGCGGYPDIDVSAWLLGGFMVVVGLGRLISYFSK